MKAEKHDISSGSTPDSTPAVSLEQIRSRLDGIKAQAADKQKQWETEKASIAKEIVDMAEGNKALDERVRKSSAPYAGAGHGKMLEKIQNDNQETRRRLTKMDGDHNTVGQEIQKLRVELTKQQGMASEGDREQYAQLLRELEQQFEALNQAYEKERAEGERTLESQKAEYDALQKRVGQFSGEMDKTTRDPHKFATETVLSGRREITGKDYKDQKGEIENAVRGEADIREYYKDAKNELPKMEIYLASVEAAFDTFEKTLADSSEKAETEFKAIEEDFDGRIQEIVTTKSQIIEEGRNPGFLARLRNAGFKGTQAETELRSLKAQQSMGLNAARDLLGAPVVEVYYALAHSGGGQGNTKQSFDDATFSNNFPIYKLEHWDKLVEKNPAVFEAMAGKIKELKERGSAINSRREELLSTYNRVYNNINNRLSQLSTKLEQMFAF